MREKLLFFLPGNTIMLGKKVCEMERNESSTLPRLHSPRQKICPRGLSRVNEDQAPGGDAASGIDVINKSVNGVSGLMSVVTRWLRADGR